jgi:hypothetical protein
MHNGNLHDHPFEASKAIKGLTHCSSIGVNKNIIALTGSRKLLPAGDPLALAAALHQHLHAFQMDVGVVDLAAA